MTCKNSQSKFVLWILLQLGWVWNIRICEVSISHLTMYHSVSLLTVVAIGGFPFSFGTIFIH